MTSKAARPLWAALVLGLWGAARGADEAPSAGVSADIDPTSQVLALTNALTPDEESAGWKLLFNGSDLSGWRAQDSSASPSNWTIRDTSLTYTGRGPTSILSTEAFGDFELTLDWKVGKGDDAGIYFRIQDESQPPGKVAPEVQLIDNRWNIQAMEPKRSAGACTHLYAPSRDATLPVNSFNRLRVVAVGGQVQHWLNGQKVVEYVIGSEDWNSRLAKSPLAGSPALGASPRGYLGLQQTSSTVRFRNIKIRPLGMALGIARARPARRAAPMEGVLRGLLLSAGGPHDIRGRSVKVTSAGAGAPARLMAGN